MAYETKYLTLSNATDAEFRAWGSAISNFIAANGWVRTGETGQVNWTTVLKPSGANNFPASEIFRSNDGGGGLTEMYVRVEYGSGNFGAPYFGMRISAGFGSDGSGALTNPKTDSAQFQYGYVSALPVNHDCNLSVGTGWFVINVGYESSGNPCGVWSVERLRDNAGAQIDEILTYVLSNNNQVSHQVVKPSRSYPYVTFSYGTMLPPSTADIADGEVGLGIMMGQHGGLTNPSLNLMCAWDRLGPRQNVIPGVQRYGAPHQYIRTGTSQFIFQGSASTKVLLQRWE